MVSAAAKGCWNHGGGRARRHDTQSRPSPADSAFYYGETAPHSKVDSSRDFILLMAAIRAVFLLIHEARSSPVQSSIAKY